jgi:hypothetical protein
MRADFFDTVVPLLSVPLPRVWDEIEGGLAEPKRVTDTHAHPSIAGAYGSCEPSHPPGFWAHEPLGREGTQCEHRRCAHAVHFSRTCCHFLRPKRPLSARACRRAALSDVCVCVSPPPTHTHTHTHAGGKYDDDQMQAAVSRFQQHSRTDIFKPTARWLDVLHTARVRERVCVWVSILQCVGRV